MKNIPTANEVLGSFSPEDYLKVVREESGLNPTDLAPAVAKQQLRPQEKSQGPSVS